MTKVLFFTAGPVPTSGELTGIAATGTKVTLTVTDGKISAVALSA